MVSKMEGRRQEKKVNTEEGLKKYRRLSNELRRITDEAYENWWKKECASLEFLERQGRIYLLYTRIKEIREEKKLEISVTNQKQGRRASKRPRIYQKEMERVY